MLSTTNQLDTQNLFDWFEQPARLAGVGAGALEGSHRNGDAHAALGVEERAGQSGAHAPAGARERAGRGSGADAALGALGNVSQNGDAEADGDGREGGPWAARTPRRPTEGVDLLLFPRTPEWRADEESLAALEELERRPWVARVARGERRVEVQLADGWVESQGAALEAGGDAETTLRDLAAAQRFSVQFWDPNATKALHVGHLRNLAIGNAIAAALRQAGGQVERRSLISDAGRSIGEAMAGVLMSGQAETGDEKSDHFVGVCYANYVSSGGLFAPEQELERPEDSHTREVQVQDDTADELIKRVLAGEREALALWYKTRAWVIAGQRKTLSRLGLSFDRVFFESDFLQEAAGLMDKGLAEGWLRRREDGVVIYPTGLEDLEELPLMRADGLPTQYMRSLSYCVSAPELDGMVSMQVCGSEWVSHAASIRKLVEEQKPNGEGFHPRHSIFHGMVARQKRSLSSSEGALLIDELMEWLEQQIDSNPTRREIRRAHPTPEAIAAQIVLGYFLPHPVTPRIDFEPEGLLADNESLGWDLVRARARHGTRSTPPGYSPVEDPEYRFAVLQGEIYRRHLRQALERFDVVALGLYLRHLTRWYSEQERNGYVERVVHTLLDRSARGLGLEGGR
jgi:arginyl-tRNA synthetase